MKQVKAATTHAHAHDNDDDEMPEIAPSDPRWKSAKRGVYAKRDLRYTLELLRKSLSITQDQVATRMETTQGDISRIESREDWRVSTLERYAKAIGGKLVVSVQFDDRRYELALD